MPSPGVLWRLLAAVLVLVVGIAAYQQMHAAPPLPRRGQAPDFALTDRDGRTLGSGDLAGRPWIADFIFTRCVSSCPLLSARMAVLDRELPQEVRLVSFSVDPSYDTPPVLAAYARSFAASPRWHFLTGREDAMRHLARDGFKLPMEPGMGGGSGGEAVLHATRFVLIDGGGEIRGYYRALEPQSVADLVAAARALARRPGGQ